MALDAIVRLPDELLEWFGVMTHLHPGGNSECSGQQSPSDIATVLKLLGVKTGVITPHTGNPSKPYIIDPNGIEMAVLKEVANDVVDLNRHTGVDLRFGLECNTVPDPIWQDKSSFSCELDTSDEMISSLGSTYTVGSLHGDATPYKDASRLYDAVSMLCRNSSVDSLGHITRYVSDVDVEWLKICRLAAKTNTLIELNLNLWFKEHGQNKIKPADHPNVVFHRSFLEDVARSGAKVVIGIDAHNLGMFPQSKASAGWETTIERCLHFVDAIIDSGITQDRVVSANTIQWDQYFSQPKENR